VGVVTDNLGLMADEPALTPEAEAAARRQSGIRLAAAALTITGGDTDAAAEMLKDPLEAIGALPYEAAAGKYRWGQAG
jgi:hypothetical protein